MLSKYALWKVVEALITGKEEFSVREMGRKAKIGPSTAKTCLDYLYDTKLLNKKVIGNVYQYSLNSSATARAVRNAYITRLLEEKGAKGWLCSNEKEIVFYTIEDIITVIKTVKTTEEEMKKIRQSYLDIITIK